MKGWNICWERKGLGVAFPDFRGFPGDSDGKDSACTALDLIPELERPSGEGNALQRQRTPVFWPGVHGWRSVAGHSPWDHKTPDTVERLTLSLPGKFNSG